MTAELPQEGGYYATYRYPDGSWFRLDRGGNGKIWYAFDSRGQPNKASPLDITWGVQLDKDGYLLDRGGYYLLYVIIPNGKGSGEDGAELLELGRDHASGWRRE